MNSQTYKARIAAIQKQMEVDGLDGMVVIKPEHVRYLSGFWGYSTRTEYAMPRRLIGVIVPRRGDVTLITPKIELNMAKRRSWIPDVRHHVEWASSSSEVFGGLALLDRVLAEKGLQCGRLGVELGFISARLFGLLTGQFPRVEFCDTSYIIEAERMIKSPEEIEILRVSGRMAVAELDAELAAIKAGRREYEVANVGRDEATRLSAEYMVAHEVGEMPLDHPVNEGLQIITSADRLDMVHAPASTKRIEQGDVVLLDFCRIPQLYNYRIGFSRMASLRPLSAEETEVFDLVDRSYKAAQNYLRPGVAAEQPDLIARDILERAGLAETFVHRSGRGVGLEGVERPEIGVGDKTLLAPGMVVTVEPSIYYKGFAVHNEDTYLITENGHELLTSTPREVRVLSTT